MHELTRPEAEASITRRLRISRWFQRTAAGLGIAAGVITGAAEAGHNAAEEVSALALLVASAGSAATERTLAVRKCRQTIDTYRSTRGYFAYPEIIRQWNIEDGDLKEQLAYDYQATDLFDYSLKRPIANTFTVAAGWSGGTFLTLTAEHQMQPDVGSDGYIVGGAILGAAALFHLMGTEMDTSKLVRSYHRQLDNIDNGFTVGEAES